jgi:hypothetical protein
MNPLHDPTVQYLRTLIAVRVDRLRTEDRSMGVSAIEWAIITGMLAAIAVAIYAIIKSTITDKANEISKNGSY